MRKRSPETELRHVKRELKLASARIAELSAELRERRRVGGRMSNVCFNGAQSDELPQDFREPMASCRKEWDDIRSVGRLYL